MREARSKWAPSAEAAEREIRRSRRQRFRKRRRRAALAALAIALALGALASAWGLQLVVVRGTGMSPTVESGSVVVCVRQSALDALRGIVPEDLRRVRRGDVVLIRYEDESDGAVRSEPALLVKRVVGLGGDVIDVADAAMTVGGTPVSGAVGGGDRVYPVTVPGGRMFVMGDHRNVAVDSRRRAFGMPPEASVIGRPVAVIWPAFAIGPVS